RRLRKELFRAAVSYAQLLGMQAYHNPKHFLKVYKYVLLQHSKIKGLSLAVRQCELLAAVGHDFAHQGSTLRRDAPGGIPLPHLGHDISTERVSAILFDNLLKRSGASLGARVFIAQLIIATTFGDPSIKLKTPSEKRLVCADIMPEKDFLKWMEG